MLHDGVSETGDSDEIRGSPAMLRRAWREANGRLASCARRCSTHHDPYSVLEIPGDSNEQSVKSAYFRLSKLHHPDTNPGDSPEKFIRIQNAYRAIMEEIARSDGQLSENESRRKDAIPYSFTIEPISVETEPLPTFFERPEIKRACMCLSIFLLLIFVKSYDLLPDLEAIKEKLTAEDEKTMRRRAIREIKRNMLRKKKEIEEYDKENEKMNRSLMKFSSDLRFGTR